MITPELLRPPRSSASARSFTCVSVALVAVLTSRLAANEPVQTPEPMAFAMVRPGTTTFSRVEPATVTLEAERVPVAASETVAGLLEARGLQVDGEAISLVYHLNPGIDQIPVPPIAGLNLPIIRGDPDVRQRIAEGQRLHLTLNVTSRTAFFTAVRAFASTPPPDPVAKGSGGEGVGMGFREAHARAAQALARLELEVRARARPIGRQLLRDAAAEVEALTQATRQWTPHTAAAAVRLARAVADDLEARADAFEATRSASGGLPPRWPMARLLVHAYYLPEREPAPDLRVYYVPRALHGVVPEESLDQLTSPASGRLPVANYVLWASEPGSAVPRSEIKSIQLRLTEDRTEQVIELAVPRSRP